MGTQASAAGGADQHQGFRTTCGRQVRAGRLALGDTRHPARRVSLDIGQATDGHDGTWAALTVAEARRLAAVLLAQAAAAERDDEPGAAAAAQAGRIEVSHAGGEAYAITTRGHALLVDQPADAGGGDAAATPTELLVASLAACIAYYAGRYLDRHGLQRNGLRVVAEFTMAADRRRASVPSGCASRRPACRTSGRPGCWRWRRTAPCTTPCGSRRISPSRSPDRDTRLGASRAPP